VVFVAAFYLMFSVLGLRGNAIRGDFILYLLSGIFLFLTHTKAVSAVMGSEGPTSAMMKHAPMNTAIAITSSALSSLYLQVLSAALILFFVHVAWHPVEIYKVIPTIWFFLLAWFCGVAVGMVLLAIKPFYPGMAQTIMMVYSRANMIASGKMFVANTMPGFLLAFFDWNPLFHCIDQARLYAFINYSDFREVSSPTYPLYVGLALFAIGLMGEFYARKNASLSWNAAR
jgi:ABC-type polysaccharide/polyol phosphate export permease